MNAKLRCWTLSVGVVLVAIWAEAGQAGLRIVPAAPQVGDTVRVEVDSWFPSTCWRDTGQTCAVGPDDSLKFTVDVGYCSGMPSCGCALVIVPYHRVCDFGVLPAGSYIAVFTERHVSPYDPEPGFTWSLPFSVIGPVPARTHSWGRIKTLFR